MAQIINRIDVNYFRSISSISMTQCKDVNLLIGGNDSGKSNMLKALNLFFNGWTEPHSGFDFVKDLNRYREQEARDAKGRMSIWIKVHFNNFLKWDSLPPLFSIKRVWTRYDTRPTDTFSDQIPATTIGRFLNKIRYHYVPAVRSREIFSDLLAEMHDTLLQDESLGLRQSSDALVEDLHNITRDMSAEILEQLKIESTINIPESLRDLFRALDFSTKFGIHDIPLVLRGDGIQSRHLPFILDYIAKKSKQHHIWGYEEPENSLELSKAFEMATEFKERFSSDNQIFLTTHSPAFYDISGDNSSRWFVENREEANRHTTVITPITAVADVDKTMGLLSVITPRMKAVYDEFTELKSSVGDLQEKLAAADCPLVYVEGPTDVTILNRAKEVLGFQALNVRFESAGGAGELTQFLKVNSRVKRDRRALIGIYDADARGRKEFENFRSAHLFGETNLRTISRPHKIFAGILKSPEHLNAAQAAFRAIGMPLPLPIEFMFDSAIINEAIQNGVLELASRVAKIANEELPLEVNVDNVIVGRVDQEFYYLAKAITAATKVQFSNWVIQKGQEAFEPFRSLFEELSLAVAEA